MMKKSFYNIYQRIDSKNVLYNTISGAVVVLDEEDAKLYNQISSLDKGKENGAKKKFMDDMIRGGFLIADEIDESAIIKQVTLNSRNSTNSCAFTIAPTMACNFSCPYCFEKGRKYNTMNQGTINGVIEFINKSIDNLSDITNIGKFVSLSWYGGEPLLAPEIIKEITDGICKEKIQFDASIVTNGFYLDKKMAMFLKALHIDHAQVTIDGPPKIHNERRCLQDRKDTFFHILNNISEACEYISITIRINVDKNNMADIDEVLYHLDEFNLKGKVNIYLAPVDNINGTFINSPCLAAQEFSEYEAAFYSKHICDGYTFIYLPSFNPDVCGAVCKDTFVIDPIGDLYKCWNEIGMKEYSCGNIYSNLMNENVKKWDTYDHEFYEDCKSCKFLPICMGGCPYHNLKVGEKRCMHIAYNYHDMLRLLLDLSQIKEDETLDA